MKMEPGGQQIILGYWGGTAHLLDSVGLTLILTHGGWAPGGCWVAGAAPGVLGWQNWASHCKGPAGAGRRGDSWGRGSCPAETSIHFLLW